MTLPDEDEHLGPFAELFGSFNLSLNSLTDELRRGRVQRDRDEQRSLENLPRQIALYQQSTYATGSVATTDLLDFGSPVAGRQWEIRLLAVISALSTGFVTMGTTVTTWYTGQKMSGAATGILPLGFVRWQFPSVPNFNEFSGDQFKVLPQEHLYAGLTGIPAAPTSIMAIAVVNDLPLYVGRPVVQG